MVYKAFIIKYGYFKNKDKKKFQYKLFITNGFIK